MKRLIYTVLLWFLSVDVFAQIATDEQPVSFVNPEFASTLAEQRFDLQELPRLDMEAIQKEDKEDEQMGIPPRFGFTHEVSYNLDNSGTWVEMEDGDRVWQLHIHCPGALSINLLYDEFHIPQGAKLFLYTPDKEHYIGAFSEVNNKGTTRGSRVVLPPDCYMETPL